MVIVAAAWLGNARLIDNIRGLESQGMLLAAESDDGALSLLTVEKEIASGASIR